MDTGAWVALNLPSDSLHRQAAAAYAGLPPAVKLVTTSDVYDESMTRSRYDGGMTSVERLQRRIGEARNTGKLDLIWVDAGVYDAAWEIMQQNPGVKLSFTDATSVVVARRLKIKSVFGFDADFRALGFELIPGQFRA